MPQDQVSSHNTPSSKYKNTSLTIAVVILIECDRAIVRCVMVCFLKSFQCEVVLAQQCVVWQSNSLGGFPQCTVELLQMTFIQTPHLIPALDNIWKVWLLDQSTQTWLRYWPVHYSVERLLVCDVVHQDEAHSTAVVRCSDCSVPLLSRRVL